MNNDQEMILKEWAVLKEKNFLTIELEVSSEVLLASKDLKNKVSERFNYLIAHEKKIAAANQREKEYKALVWQALKLVLAQIATHNHNLAEIEAHILGSVGTSGERLYIYAVLPSRENVVNALDSDEWKNFQQKLATELASVGYPTQNLPAEWIHLFSQEECNEVANGNWYYFFK